MNSFFHPRWQSWLVKPGWVDFASASLTSATDARTTRLRRTRAPVIGPRLARTRWANPHDELSALTRRPFRVDWTVRPGTGEAGAWEAGLGIAKSPKKNRQAPVGLRPPGSSSGRAHTNGVHDGQ